MAKARTERDGPWKRGVELHLESLLLICFAGIHAQIDWKKGILFLDQELNEIIPEANIGRQRVDKLIRVWLLDGTQAVLYIHLEIQNQRVTRFSTRIYEYHFLLVKKLGRQVLTLVVLGDDSPGWRPARYEEDVLGCCRVKFDYPVCKLLDLVREKEGELRLSREPAAWLILANHEVNLTGGQPEERKRRKLALIKAMFKAGVDAKEMRNLFEIMDYMIALPRPLEEEFRIELQKDREMKTMRHVATMSEMILEEGIAKGIEKGMEKGIAKGKLEMLREMIVEELRERFKRIPRPLEKRVKTQTDLSLLKQWRQWATRAASLDEFESQLSSRA